MLDEESFEYATSCNDVGQCYERLLVGCDDDQVAAVWDGDEGDLELAAEGRELRGLLYHDVLLMQRLGGMDAEEADARGESGEVTTRFRIDESFSYVRVGAP